ncbi:MAG TPA: hypothetical protein PKA63_02035 [Oligoflexia bacterium]|nr:hypothetical protein [Oligoflexia bacterium]HMP47430.1 hypothetical protein [Oligoflexia bacterium]
MGKLSYFWYPYLLPVLFLLSGCSLTILPNQYEGCKFRAYINNPFVDYVSSRFEKDNVPRVAIIPFDVPENFSPPFNPNLRFGHRLAQSLQEGFLARGESMIIEVFNRDWPGKRIDFSAGNFQAIRQARDAGYDFVVVGLMEEFTNDLKMRVHTKVIDTDNSITVWYGTTDVTSNARSSRKFLNIGSKGLYPMRDDLYEIEPRIDRFSECTAAEIFKSPY